jgi:hypothetical protein
MVFSHRANASVSASYWEVKELDLGCPYCPSSNANS